MSDRHGHQDPGSRYATREEVTAALEQMFADPRFLEHLAAISATQEADAEAERARALPLRWVRRLRRAWRRGRFLLSPSFVLAGIRVLYGRG